MYDTMTNRSHMLMSVFLQWRKYWFILSAHSLCFDPAAEEASSQIFPSITFTRNSLFMHSSLRILLGSIYRLFLYCFSLKASELAGEIGLTTCHRVTELHDQRNVDFEIWVYQIIYKWAFYINR